MTTYLFPGQGSQTKGMGADLFPLYPELVNQANTLLGYSIETLCLDDPFEQLGNTQYTQPALYIVNALSYLNKAQKPNSVAGHSLGEYNALFAAEVFDFQTGLKLVQKRGELMSQASGGAMTAVIGLTLSQIESVLDSSVTIANYNSHTQFVLSGLKADIERLQPLLQQAGAKMVVPLKVSGALHSRYMQSAQREFIEFLKQFEFQRPNIPVIANNTARPYAYANTREHLATQITAPVRWTESIEYLLAQGEANFEEIGPGNVLAKLVKRIQNGS